MANEERLSILKQGVEVWNEWRAKNYDVGVDLSDTDLPGANLGEANLSGATLRDTDLSGADLGRADLSTADLSRVYLYGVNLREANLREANLRQADLRQADLRQANLRQANLLGSIFLLVRTSATIFGNLDLSEASGLEAVVHSGPSSISTDTFARSKGKIPEVFLQGCGLSDWEIEQAKLYNPDLHNDEFIDIQNRIFDLRQRQALQISPLFISYSHADSGFVDRISKYLTEKGIRHWRDIKDLKSGRVEKQLDRAIRQNPTVLLVLSEHSISSDWVEHEVRVARQLEKDIERDVLCPVALDNSWKDSRWPKRVMEQIMEYNILDFSAWKDDSKFGGMFRKLIDGLELFYKG